MWKSIFKWATRSKPEPKEGSTIFETLLNQLGDLDEIIDKPFAIARARSIVVTVVSDDLKGLSARLIDASTVVSENGHFSSQWKTPVTYHECTLETFITEDDSLVHPLDWIREHRHYIIKLLDAFMKMDDADSAYYQRKCIFVIEDVLALLAAGRKCIR